MKNSQTWGWHVASCRSPVRVAGDGQSLGVSRLLVIGRLPIKCLHASGLRAIGRLRATACCRASSWAVGSGSIAVLLQPCHHYPGLCWVARSRASTRWALRRAHAPRHRVVGQRRARLRSRTVTAVSGLRVHPRALGLASELCRASGVSAPPSGTVAPLVSPLAASKMFQVSHQLGSISAAGCHGANWPLGRWSPATGQAAGEGPG